MDLNGFNMRLNGSKPVQQNDNLSHDQDIQKNYSTEKPCSHDRSLFGEDGKLAEGKPLKNRKTEVYEDIDSGISSDSDSESDTLLNKSSPLNEAQETTSQLQSAEPIRLKENKFWINKKTRSTCKYSPVIVAKGQSQDAKSSMRLVEDNRLKICQELKSDGTIDSTGWYSFIRGNSLANESTESKYKNTNEPVIVLSGGSAKKIASDIEKDFSLAWHPRNLRDEPVYLFVHKLDFENYAAALKEPLDRYANFHLVAWDGGKLTGFGAARAAALSFANSLTYKPKRILMMDQDVVQTEETRHTSPLIKKNIEKIHDDTGKQVVAYGVGYPTRRKVPKPFSKVLKPEPPDYNSPAQQFVSILSPFLRKGKNELYPEYMVSGGEDVLMGRLLGLSKNKKNTVLPDNRIVKKQLTGEADPNNDYWNKARVETLKELFRKEKNVQVDFEGSIMTLNELMHLFVDNGWIDSHPSPESYNVAASIIERIILRHHSDE